uniref:Uncharacterized protein n=1 Tax=Cacopsylla melanoneura TaxID=428564 RepID=A0A8D8QF46_9HEMI
MVLRSCMIGPFSEISTFSMLLSSYSSVSGTFSVDGRIASRSRVLQFTVDSATNTRTLIALKPFIFLINLVQSKLQYSGETKLSTENEKKKKKMNENKNATPIELETS